ARFHMGSVLSRPPGAQAKPLAITSLGCGAKSHRDKQQIVSPDWTRGEAAHNAVDELHTIDDDVVLNSGQPAILHTLFLRDIAPEEPATRALTKTGPRRHRSVTCGAARLPILSVGRPRPGKDRPTSDPSF